MPAVSDPAESPVALPHTWRPLGVRIAAAVLGTGLLVICVFTWIGFDDETQAKFTFLQRATLAAFGLLVVLLFHALVRSRIVAEAERLVIVNGYRRREYDWAQLVAVHLPPGAPWVTIDLADGTTVSAMGIQGSDGARAKQAVRELRRIADQQIQR